MKNFAVFIFTLLLAAPAIAGWPSIIKKDGAGQFYLNSIRPMFCLADAPCLLRGSVTPSSSAVFAPAGSLYLNTSGNLFVKSDAGLSTNWTKVGLSGASLSGSSLSVLGTTAFTWSGGSVSTALGVVGTPGTGGSFFINTPSLNANFNSGLAVDGSYTPTKATVNIRAVGVHSPGGYTSELNIYTSHDGGGDAAQGLNMTFNQDLSATSFGGVQLATTASQPTCASGIRGLLWISRGATNAQDEVFACMKKADNTYAWISVKAAG